MAQLTLQDLSKVFRERRREVTALAGLSLDVADHEMVALVGPSGCGKTTTLRLIAGLEAPSGGIVRIGGTRVNDTSPRDRNIAMVFQHLALYPHRTIFENLAFPLRVRGFGRGEVRARVLAVAERLAIFHVLDRRPASISGGERQRAALGRAMVRDPSVFLFDEPLSHLDVPLRARLRAELRSFRLEQGAPMVYVTHDQEEAMILGDRVAVLRDGKLLQIGTPCDVYLRPANRFVAEFMGTTGMNLLEGRVEENGDLVTTAAPATALHLPPHLSTLLRNRAGRAILLGWRSEDLHLGSAATSALTARLAPAQHDLVDDRLALLGAMTVRDVEPIGDRARLLLLGPAGKSVTVRTPPDHGYIRGAVVQVYADWGRAHLFDADGAETRLN